MSNPTDDENDREPFKMPSDPNGRRKAKPLSTANVKNAQSNPRKLAREKSQSPNRHTQILEVSARLFAEFGFETTSVRQIADEVKILAGSLYHHFSTKEDILHEIIRSTLIQIAHEDERISHLPVDAEHRLVTTVIMRFHQYVRDWEALTIIQHDATFFRRREDFSYVQDSKSHSFRMIESILKEGMGAGLFHSDIDTYLMIGTIARLLSSAANWFRRGEIYSSDKPTDYTLDKVIDFHLDCILRMIRSPSRLNEPIPREKCEMLAMPDGQPV
jgi:AcrR family transcriptional regulator